MNQLMIDLETLDTKPSTVILSIGAVVFTERGLGVQFYRNCAWQAQLDAGRTVSESTIKWWFEQSKEAQAALFADQTSLRAALNALSSFYREHRCERAWANGQSFDISILDHAYEFSAMPWKYNAPRDMRTIRDLVPELDLSTSNKGVAHNALDDAVRQAEFVVAALNLLRPSHA